MARPIRHKPRSGVYLLIDEGSVVYVDNRSMFSLGWRATLAKKFDAHYVVDCPTSELRSLESLHIKRLILN